MTAVKSGTIIEANITRIGTMGDGVGSYNGRTLIVPKTAPGDKITCKVKYTTKDRIHADLVDILEAGSERATPPCEYYQSCGGCGLQHINSEEYKKYKLTILTDALKYNGITPPDSIGWFSVGENSRRRAFIRFSRPHPTPLQGRKGGSRLGFYEHQTHNVVDIQKCLILEPALESLLSPLKELSEKLNINIEGWLLTSTDTGIDLTLQSEDNRKIKNEAEITKMLRDFARTLTRPPSHGEGEYKLARLSWKSGKKIIPVITITNPALNIGGRNILLPTEYFIQASKSGSEEILNSVIKNIDRGAMVLDLFSGVGVYSFALADIAKHISAYEIAPEMIKSMQENISRNNLQEKISAYCRNIETAPLSAEELAKYDTAIINPPRTGALKQTNMLAASGITRIIMVSCNSQSFARDAKILYENGYQLKSLDAIDQFYYSQHLEQVGVFVL